MLVYIPSVLISILAHISIFILFLFPFQFKPNNDSLNQYVIDFQISEYNNSEDKKFGTFSKHKLFKSKKNNTKKVSVAKNANIKINKKVDNFKIKKNNITLKKKIKKINEKQVKFDFKKNKIQPADKMVWKYSNFSELRLSRFPLKSSVSNYDISLNKYKKNSHKNVNSCGPAKKNKTRENFKNLKTNIVKNKEITIAELLGSYYYNPKLVNINQLLKMSPLENNSQVNITNLLLSEEKNVSFCN